MATTMEYTRKRTASFSIHTPCKIARLNLSCGQSSSSASNLLGLSFDSKPTQPPPPLSIPVHQRIPKAAKHLPLPSDDQVIFIVAPSDPLPPPAARPRPLGSPPKPQPPRYSSPLSPHPPRQLPPRPCFPRSKKPQNLYKQALQAQLATTPAGRKIRAMGAKVAISQIQADMEFDKLMKRGRQQRWKDARDSCKHLMVEEEESSDEDDNGNDDSDSDTDSDGPTTPEGDEDALWSDVLGLGENWEKEQDQDDWHDLKPDAAESALGLCLAGF